MRSTGWLILVAIVALLAGVATTYRLQKRVLREKAPAKPQTLPAALNSVAQDWVWVQTDAAGHMICRIQAKDARQAKDANRIELEQVELRLPSKHGDNYDLVHSAHAEYNQSDKHLYSDGEVDITLALPNQGEPTHTPVSIHSSGVSFDTTGGKATTDRATSFRFENGDGQAVGASYDPNTHELHLNSQAQLHWNPPGPNAKPMKVEAGEVSYREDTGTISLAPWARMTRENTVVEGGATVITLEDRSIHHIDAQQAHGTDSYPSRSLEYGADHLWVDYNDDGEIEKMTGAGNARVVSKSEGSETTATGNWVELNFTESDNESVLTRAVVTGNGYVESKPQPEPGKDLAETRILRSEAIEMQMRPGGKEINSLTTQTPGTLEFLPNRAGQRHRRFSGEHMVIAFGAGNRVQSMRSVNCRTESDPAPDEKNHPLTVTTSKNVEATFDPKTSQLARLEQWDDFAYEAGERKARADRALLEQTENRITLENHARMWDSHENTTADRIVLDEKSGNFSATGHVNSSRLPDQSSKKTDSAMLSGDEPLQAIARTMTSANHNKLVKYDGDVLLWQGDNRIQAEHVEIDRDKRVIVAEGHVITQSREGNKEEDDTPKTAAADEGPVFTLVKAPHMAYTDQDRVAHYFGGVMLTRAGLQVKANDLRSWLAEAGADNRLVKAVAEGAVEIVQTGPLRTRTGTSEHAEYYTDENKVVLRGGNPQLNDSVRGNTRGTELTYYSDDDKLLVNGSTAQPVVSHIRRRHPR
jgi:lipopolysaccharide export system protein LptA